MYRGNEIMVDGALRQIAQVCPVAGGYIQFRLVGEERFRSVHGEALIEVKD